jgi:LacI family transcriptional regulator
MGSRRRVTIKQVALEAGVSTQTVSRVLNDRPDVAAATRQRVQKVIERLGYRPSSVARSLIKGRSASLAVVSYGIEFFGPSRVVSGIERKAVELGYTPLLGLLRQPEEEQIRPFIDTFLSRHVDGIIWAVPEIGENRSWTETLLPQLPVPIVLITMRSRPELSSVSVDNYAGGLKAVSHLQQLGRKHIAHIAGPLEWWEARERQRGWQEALTVAGTPPTQRQVVSGDWSPESGEQGLIRLLERNNKIDALFVGNDQMSLGVLKVAHRLGIRVPDDLAIVGFDDIPESPYFWPPLSTIRQPLFEVGCSAVALLEELIKHGTEEGDAGQPRTILLQPELVVRSSSSGQKTGMEY